MCFASFTSYYITCFCYACFHPWYVMWMHLNTSSDVSWGHCVYVFHNIIHCYRDDSAIPKNLLKYILIYMSNIATSATWTELNVIFFCCHWLEFWIFQKHKYSYQSSVFFYPQLPGCQILSFDLIKNLQHPTANSSNRERYPHSYSLLILSINNLKKTEKALTS